MGLNRVLRLGFEWVVDCGNNLGFAIVGCGFEFGLEAWVWMGYGCFRGFALGLNGLWILGWFQSFDGAISVVALGLNQWLRLGFELICDLGGWFDGSMVVVVGWYVVIGERDREEEGEERE